MVVRRPDGRPDGASGSAPEPSLFIFPSLLGLSHVGPQGQRGEYDHAGYRPNERQPKVVSDGALVEELPDGAHDVGQRVYVDKVLQQRGQGVGGHEGAREEYEGEEDGGGDALDELRRFGHDPEEREYPAERPRGEDDENTGRQSPRCAGKVESKD